MKLKGEMNKACFRAFLLMVGLPLWTFSQATGQYPEAVSESIAQAPQNKLELEKALNYFYATGDPLKIKAINFLIQNMPIHSSYSYYWADSTNRRVGYNEEQYSTTELAKGAFSLLETRHGKLHPVSYCYRDIDSIKAETLIDNVNLAVEKAKARGIEINKNNEEQFLEYILPYRTSIEPLQEWRKTYVARFGTLLSGNALTKAHLSDLTRNISTWFTNTYKIEARKVPLPRLGALQLLTIAKGPCEDIAGLTTYIARSNGYAAAVDFIPAWATASGMHFLNYLNPLENGKSHFDGADNIIVDTLSREPAKVFRTTFSKQQNTIASLLNDSALIPDGFLRLQNYKDVTHEYWQTQDVHARLFRTKDSAVKASFICVWNQAAWKPVWHGMKEKGDSVIYTNMCKGAVYLPMYYINRKLVPAGWPVVNGYDTTIVLKPDLANKRTVIIEDQPNYIAFRAGKKYALFYWNNTWVPAGVKLAESTFTKLLYENIPANALLLFIPEYSQGKERPFIINGNDKRTWF